MTKKKLRVWKISYPIHGGNNQKILLVAARGKKEALKKCEYLRVPAMDNGGKMKIEKINMKTHPVLNTHIV